MGNINATTTSIIGKPDETIIEQLVKSIDTSHTEKIKLHFDDAANRFDNFIQTLIPNYNNMIEILMAIIPFDEHDDFEVIDLGCGTGTISYFVNKKFSHAKITCMDISEKMLQIAADKIAADVSCISGDLNTFTFPQKYDVIVSSLALHHLETDQAKFEMYQRIYAGLKENGIFINLDIVLGSNEELQAINMQNWINFMKQNVPEREIVEKWIPSYYADDRPTSLRSHIKFLEEAGFKEVDVIYKAFNYSVFCGRKRI